MTKNLAWHQAFVAAVRAAFNGNVTHAEAVKCADIAVPDGDEPETLTMKEARRWKSTAMQLSSECQAALMMRDTAAALVTQHREGMQALADVLWFADDKTRPSLDGEVSEAWRLLIDRLTETLKGGLREIEQAEDDAASAHVRADVSSIDDQG